MCARLTKMSIYMDKAEKTYTEFETVVAAFSVLMYQFFKQDEAEVHMENDARNMTFHSVLRGNMRVKDVLADVKKQTNGFYDKKIHKYNVKTVKNSNDEDEVAVCVNDHLIIKSVLSGKYYDDGEKIEYALNKIINCVTEEEKLIKDIDVLTPYDYKRITCDFTGKTVTISPNVNFVTLFEEQAEKKSFYTAVEYHDLRAASRATYKKLNENANRIAHYLIGLFDDNEFLVALIMNRSIEMMECILGVWKAGGAYIPIDPDYPVERVNTILEDARPKLVIYEPMDKNGEKGLRLSGDSVMMDLTLLYKKVKEQSAHNPRLNIRQNQLAYVIYTSGSTGKPKGVMIEHLGMINHMLAKILDFKLSENDVIAQNASQCFDISVWQFFVSLLVGGKTIIYSNDVILEPLSFCERISKDNVTVLEVVPSYLNIMLELLSEKKHSQPQAFTTLSYIILTGERLSKDLVARWFQLFPDIPMVNAYGPTEASDDVTHFFMDKLPREPYISIGRSIINTRIYILDQNLKICPIGIAGEICIAGICLGRGYLNDAVKSNLSFLVNPGVKNEDRLYKTGDYGRWAPDGTIEYIGRKDEQVKIRGHRIELGDVKTVLMKHDGIKDAAVICMEHDNNKIIVAFLVAKKTVDTDDLDAFFRSSAPSYMMPQKYVFMDKIPLTANGKVNKKELIKCAGL